MRQRGSGLSFFVSQTELDKDRGVITLGGSGCKVVTTSVPGDVLDCDLDSDHNHNTLFRKLVHRLGPLSGGLLLCRVPGGICGGSVTVLEQSSAFELGLGVEYRGDDEI